MGSGMSTLPLQHHRLARLRLDSGGTLHDVEQAYTLDGTLNAAADNLIVVFHSLTGDAQPRRWWQGVVGPDCAIDTDRYAVLCVNLVGSCYGTRWRAHDGKDTVQISTRDMATAAAELVQDLGASRPALVTGGSLGGMVALEWAASFPDAAHAVVSFAAPAAHTAQAIAWGHVQRRALQIGGAEGLALARMAAMISYRSAGEFQSRFGREQRDDGRFQVQSYLEHQADKLVERFDRDTYLLLLDVMDTHDVGRGRGDIATALTAYQGRLFGIGISGDLLYSEHDVRQWTEVAGAQYRQIDSIHGHDAFLLERDQVAAILAEALDGGQQLRDSRTLSRPTALNRAGGL